MISIMLCFALVYYGKYILVSYVILMILINLMRR